MTTLGTMVSVMFSRHRVQHFTLTAVEPYITSRGRTTQLLTWASMCAMCGNRFLQRKTADKKPDSRHCRDCAKRRRHKLISLGIVKPPKLGDGAKRSRAGQRTRSEAEGD